MKTIATLQCVLWAGWIATVQAQDPAAGNTNGTLRAPPAPRPAAVTVSDIGPTNAVEAQSEPEAPLFEGKSLELYGIGPGWKATAEGATVTGPLAEPFVSSRPSEVPRRFLNLFNPLAPMQPPPVTLHRSTVKGLSSRSWASVVGWRPGRSEFQDVSTHEPSSGLLVFKCSR